MDEYTKRMTEYYSRLRPLGFEVHESEILGDGVIIDEQPTPLSRGKIITGNFYKLVIGIWGVSEESLSWCKDWALRKVYSKIDKYK